MANVKFLEQLENSYIGQISNFHKSYEAKTWTNDTLEKKTKQ